MLYDSSNKILKNGSLTSKIYFLLLTKPLTISEISKLVYGGKVQLGHINKVIDTLEKAGYIEEDFLTREERREKSIDLRCRYWKASYKPLIEYCVIAIRRRIKDSPSVKKEELNERDIKTFNSILTSGWFSSFYNEEFLRTQHGEVMLHSNVVLSDTPIRFLTFMLEELFSIRMALQKFVNFEVIEDELIPSFDDYTKKYSSLIEEKTRKRINTAIKKAKQQLGNYKSTNLAIDYYMKNYKILFIPYNLAEKLSTIGRVPLTILVAFNNAVGSTR